MSSSIDNQYMKRALLEKLLVKRQIMENMARSEDLSVRTHAVPHDEYSRLVDLSIKQLRQDLDHKQQVRYD